MRIGRKSRKIALSALSVTLAATMAFTLCANALPAGKTNASGKSIENVTGKYDTTDLRNSLINSDLLAESARDQDEQFWIFVNLKGDSVSERYDPSSDESLSEYATSEEASSISRTLISRQAAFLNELDRQGVEYTYKYSYTVLENSVGIRVRYGDISRICKMSGVESVAVSEHYAAPQAVTTNDAFKPVCKYWDRITRPEMIMTALINAMRVLTDPAETGACCIALCQDVEGESFDFPEYFFKKRVHRTTRPVAVDEELEDLACRCSRELEHSSANQKRMEAFMAEHKLPF